MRIVISSGHGLYVRGASGYLDEVDEARKVVETVARDLRRIGVNVVTFHDNMSRTQEDNLNAIVDFHNSQDRDLDVSVHFNAYETTSKPMGTEVLYVTQGELAGDLSAAIADAAQLPDRGGKYRSDLFFLNNTDEPAILIETCFVDSSADADAYRAHYSKICLAIADVLSSGAGLPEQPPRPERPERPPERPPSSPADALLHVTGPCSWFGGPADTGVDADEGLAFLYDVEDAPHLFLYDQPPGTDGLARRLDPGVMYVACRWDYDRTPKDMLRDQSRKAEVRARGKSYLAYPADWGPHEDTGRVADISPALLHALDLTTDDEVEVIYPAEEGSEVS